MECATDAEKHRSIPVYYCRVQVRTGDTVGLNHQLGGTATEPACAAYSQRHSIEMPNAYTLVRKIQQHAFCF